MIRATTLARASLLAALALPSLVRADDAPKFPGQPSVGLAQPAGWHRGATVDLEIPGKGLFAPKDLLFYKSGIEVVSVKPLLDREMDDRERYSYRRKEEAQFNKRQQRNKKKDKPAEKFDPDAIEYPRKEIPAGTRVVAKLKIKPDAEPGEYPFRLVAGGGMGSLQTFWVGKFPTVTESELPNKAERNDTREDAEAIALNHTVNGHIARYDKDVYKVSAKKNSRLTFEVEAARLSSYERGDYLDVQIAVHDAKGKQLAAADDSALYLEDPYVSFKAPADGDYFVTVEESVPSGSSSLLPYRLHVTGGLRPAMLYPAGGQPGQTVKVNAILGAGESVDQKITLPKANAPSTVEVEVGKNTPAGNPVRIFPGPNVLEDKPVASAVPVALNGIISKPGETDTFRVPMQAGKSYTVQLFSSALGSRMDASMSIAPAEKPNKKKRFSDSNEDELNRLDVERHRDRLDPAGVYTADADGEYLIVVEDSRGEGSPESVYRVEIAEASPSVLTYIVPARNNEPRRGNRVQMAPGSRYAAVVALRNGFGTEAEGEFELVATNLPKGVTLKAPTFTSASARLPVVFQCAKWVKPTATLIDLRVKPVGGGKPLAGGFRSTVQFNDIGGNYYMRQCFLDKLAFSVTEAAPFKLIVETPKASLTQDGELAIKVRLDRAPGFGAPVEINTEWLPPNAGRPSPVTLRDGDKSAEFIIGARRNTPPEDYRIAFMANSTGDRRTGNGMVFGSSDFVTLKVTEPYLTAKMPRAAVEIGKTAEFVTKLEHLNDFKGKATVKLGRLPAGVEMVGGPLTVKPGQKELKFTIRADETALTGSYRGMFCALEFTDNGQTVSQRSGYGTLRIDAKRGGKKVAARE